MSIARLAGLADPAARVAASLILRVSGLALLGLLSMLTIGTNRLDRRSLSALILAPALAIAALAMNYGYFPISAQIQIAVASAVLGALTGLALRRNLIAAIAVVVATGGLFGWGAATGIDDETDAIARAARALVMEQAEDIPEGDKGFERLLEIAFTIAANNSRRGDPVRVNEATILALAVILGDERVADVAHRRIDPEAIPAAEKLRSRITVHGRQDWSRHFWVSAGLTLLSDEERSLTVGLTKELVDTAPGGSGFSFADLAADAAGSAFALAATRDTASARETQRRIVQGVRLEDFVPDLSGLPEGISSEEFQRDYGGLGGAGTNRVLDEIRRRLATSAGRPWSDR